MVMGEQKIRTTGKLSWSVFSVPWARSLRPAGGPKEGLKGGFPAPKEFISRPKEGPKGALEQSAREEKFLCALR